MYRLIPDQIITRNQFIVRFLVRPTSFKINDILNKKDIGLWLFVFGYQILIIETV